MEQLWIIDRKINIKTKGKHNETPNDTPKHHRIYRSFAKNIENIQDDDYLKHESPLLVEPRPFFVHV